MKIAGTTALVTGANRGIGASLVRHLLDRGATRVYAAARSTDSLADAVAANPDRIVAVELDVNDGDSVSAAAEMANDIDLLVNNAGYAARGTALDADLDDAAMSMNTNVFGTLRATRAFVPVLAANGGGAIVNIVSMLALAPIRGVATYAASKAALDSLTISMRADLADLGIDLHAVYPAVVDTRMAEGLDLPKAAVDHVAAAILAGVEAGDDVITPDDTSRGGRELWTTDPRGFQAFMGAL